jgi:hypothetical protein
MGIVEFISTPPWRDCPLEETIWSCETPPSRRGSFMEKAEIIEAMEALVANWRYWQVSHWGDCAGDLEILILQAKATASTDGRPDDLVSSRG